MAWWVSTDLYVLDIDGADDPHYHSPFLWGERWYFRLTPEVAAVLKRLMQTGMRRFQEKKISPCDWQQTLAEYQPIKEWMRANLDARAVAAAVKADAKLPPRPWLPMVDEPQALEHIPPQGSAVWDSGAHRWMTSGCGYIPLGR